MLEQRIAAAVREFVFVLLAAWGLVGSVLYVWHSETLQRSAQAQADLIRQQAVQIQQYDTALRKLREQAPEAGR